MRAPTIVFAVLLALGCAPKDRAVRLERLAAERRALDAKLDRLENRLVTTQARVRFWREMRDRHESVSAIACVVQDEHADEMAVRRPPPEHSSLHRARLAAAPRAAPAERIPAAASRGAGRGGGGK